MQAYAYPENRQPCADRSGCNAHKHHDELQYHQLASSYFILRFSSLDQAAARRFSSLIVISTFPPGITGPHSTSILFHLTVVFPHTRMVPAFKTAPCYSCPDRGSGYPESTNTISTEAGADIAFRQAT